MEASSTRAWSLVKLGFLGADDIEQALSRNGKSPIRHKNHDTSEKGGSKSGTPCSGIIRKQVQRVSSHRLLRLDLRANRTPVQDLTLSFTIAKRKRNRQGRLKGTKKSLLGAKKACSAPELLTNIYDAGVTFLEERQIDMIKGENDERSDKTRNAPGRGPSL